MKVECWINVWLLVLPLDLIDAASWSLAAKTAGETLGPLIDKEPAGRSRGRYLTPSSTPYRLLFARRQVRSCLFRCSFPGMQNLLLHPRWIGDLWNQDPFL